MKGMRLSCLGCGFQEIWSARLTFRQRSTRNESLSTISWVACRKSWERPRIPGLPSAAETDAAGQTKTELLGVEVEAKEVEVEESSFRYLLDTVIITQNRSFQP